MAQGKKKFNKNPVAKKSSKKAKPGKSKHCGHHVGRIKAPRRTAAINASKLKADLTRALGQRIEHDMARQATINSIELRVVSAPPSEPPSAAAQPSSKAAAFQAAVAKAAASKAAATKAAASKAGASKAGASKASKPAQKS